MGPGGPRSLQSCRSSPSRASKVGSTPTRFRQCLAIRIALTFSRLTALSSPHRIARMGKVRVSSYAISVDGFAAGPRQSLENPLGVRGPELFEWFFSTRTWNQMHGKEDGSTGVDDDWARRGMENAGAWILGRNMFGPVRGPWPDDSWNGWWGEDPPYH